MSISENSYLVNSFHAVNPATGETYDATEAGVISLSTGDEVIFVDPFTEKPTHVNTLVVKALTDVKLQLDDNELYPFYVEEGEMKGLQYLSVYKLKALADCTLYYEGLVS